MKFGSVKFFKVLIVATYLLLLLVPLALAIVFGMLYAREKTHTGSIEAAYAQLTAEYNALGAAGAGREIPIDAPLGVAGASFAYQELYPDLYVDRPAATAEDSQVCYLTFDDGPSASSTAQILTTLEEYDIKATFFVTGEASEKNPEVLRAAVAAGHSVGVHSYSHDYAGIYASVEAYLEDFDRMFHTIEQLTGLRPSIFRFAGGSINVYNQTVYTEIIAEMTRRGFVFFDWNAAGSDAVIGGIGASEIANNVLQSAAGRERVLVLLHDRPDNGTTAAALPAIIQGLQAQGYHFSPLTNQVKPITYFLPD